MDDRFYDYPLTIKVHLQDGWENIKAVQDGQTVDAQVVEHDDAKFALIQVVPDHGQTVITAAR